MKTIVRPSIEFEVLGRDLGVTEGPVIADDGVYCVDIDGVRVLCLASGQVDVVVSRSGRVVQAAWPRPGLPLNVGKS